MRITPCVIAVAALTVSTFSYADREDVYFFLSLDSFQNVNTGSTMDVLQAEFPAHTIFVGRTCQRFCSQGASGNPDATGASFGVGYAFSDTFSLEFSRVDGPEIFSTVAQTGNPVWYRTKSAVNGWRLDGVLTRSLSPEFSLQGSFGLKHFSSDVSFSSYRGGDGPFNVLSRGSFTSRDLTAILRGGIRFDHFDKVSFGVDLSFYVGSEFSYERSIGVQMKINPF